MSIILKTSSRKLYSQVFRISSLWTILMKNKDIGSQFVTLSIGDFVQFSLGFVHTLPNCAFAGRLFTYLPILRAVDFVPVEMHNSFFFGNCNVPFPLFLHTQLVPNAHFFGRMHKSLAKLFWYTIYVLYTKVVHFITTCDDVPQSKEEHRQRTRQIFFK